MEEEKRIFLLNRGSVTEEKTNSDTDPELEQYDAKIAKLRKAYWDHQLILESELKRKPGGPWIREWDLKRRRKRQGMTLQWWEASEFCAPGGGCCGRTCGCCENPLRTYVQPNPGRSCRKVEYIYGHCTAECRCCTQSKGAKIVHQNFVNFMERYGGI
jgi:hypothetical protein